MVAIAGGIVLAFFVLALVGYLGRGEDGEFSFGVLFGNVLAIGLVLLVVAALVILVLVKTGKA
ncbi:MAG: hypothetical protein KIT31_13835 [Deltaproteobacteria bacterium]|nr:hypothetical protein [Deltaproteobacteria bacterium]